jgi:hypothetical protein
LTPHDRVTDSNEQKQCFPTPPGNISDSLQSMPVSFVPGALDLDPLLRNMCHIRGLEISEHALWTILIAMREFVKSILHHAAQTSTHDASAARDLRLSENNGIPCRHTIIDARAIGRAHLGVQQKLKSGVRRFQSSFQRQILDQGVQLHGAVHTLSIGGEHVAETRREIYKTSYELRKQEFQALHPGQPIPHYQCDIDQLQGAEHSSNNRQRRGRGMKDLLALRTARSERNLSCGSGGASSRSNEAVTAVSRATAAANVPVDSVLHGEAGSVKSRERLAEAEAINADAKDSANAATSISALSQSVIFTGATNTPTSEKSIQSASSSPLPAMKMGPPTGGRRVGMKDLAALRARKLTVPGTTATSSVSSNRVNHRPSNAGQES